MKNNGLLFLLILVIGVSAFGQTNPVSFQDFRPVHMGGNWGPNFENLTNTSTPTIPTDYFTWLNKIGANWVGIMVQLNLENSLDSIVNGTYNANMPTFTDAALRTAIRQLRDHGFHVYVTLAFEDSNAKTSAQPMARWMLGDPTIPNATILAENWPWALNHPKHAQFVKSFFRTYTEQAVHFATIAEQEGAELFSLGTETERLFRTRSDNNQWPNHFKAELVNMVGETRKVYHGLLSYDMHYDALVSRNYYGAGSDHLWEDLNLDVVGISAYFPLLSTNPTLPMQLTEAQQAWAGIFTSHLLPLQQRNPTKPILFLEFGYTNSVSSPYNPTADEFTPKTFHDINSNGLDDGEETQSNIYQGFFMTNELNERVVKGAFLWGNEIDNDLLYDSDWNTRLHFGIRKKLAEQPVTAYYLSIRDLPFAGNAIAGDSLLCVNPGNSSFTTTAISRSTSYAWTLTPTESGAVFGNGLTAMVNWADTFTGTAKISVQGKNAAGVGKPSSTFTVMILPKPIADFTTIFNNNAINIVNNSSNATGYTWMLNGTPVSSIANPVIEIAQPGNYSLMLTASNGACSDSITKTIDLVVTGFESQSESAALFPNPASSYITVRTPGPPTYKTVYLVDAIGREVLTEPMVSHELTLDIRGLPAGLYFIVISNEKDRRLQTLKVLKL